MGYDEFSTKDADYVVRYGLHRKNPISPEEIFDNKNEGVDAVVLEVRGSKVWTHGSVRKTFRKLLNGKTQKEDYDVIEYCQKRQIPIYVTGMERTRKGYILFWTSFILLLLFVQFTLPLILIFALVLFYIIPRKKKKKVSKFMSFLMALQFMFCQSMGGAGVNALCAKKMEEYVVPKLRKKLKRRPKIGLNYGLAHIGMRVDFQSKRFREFNLMTLQYMNVEFWKKWGGYRGKIGRIYRADFNEKIGKWKVRVFETHFFDE
ncbi:MAG: hypothetical protein ABIF18_03460 [archaeon]